MIIGYPYSIGRRPAMCGVKSNDFLEEIGSGEPLLEGVIQDSTKDRKR
jgi:hypothetical protein